MKPVTASVTVSQSREEVFDFLEVEWLQMPVSERLMGPITRSVVGRANAKSLRRLPEALTDRRKEEAR